MGKKKEKFNDDIQKILYNEDLEADVLMLTKGSEYSEEVDSNTLLIISKGVIELKYVFKDNFTKYVRISENEAFYFKKGSSFSLKGISNSKIIKIKYFAN